MKTYAIKRNNFFSLFIIAPIILLVAAEILSILSSRANATYEIERLQTVMICCEVAVLLLALIFIFSPYLRGNIGMIIVDAVRLAAVVLVCLCLYIVLDERATLMGYVWFSDLESGNAASVRALQQGVIASVLYAAALACLAVSGCIEFVNAKSIKRSKEAIEAEISALEEELKALDG